MHGLDLNVLNRVLGNQSFEFTGSDDDQSQRRKVDSIDLVCDAEIKHDSLEIWSLEQRKAGVDLINQ